VRKLQRVGRIGICVQQKLISSYLIMSLHFAWDVDGAKCIVVTHVCVSVWMSAAACPHYCTDPDVTLGNGMGCPLVVHYWEDSQSVHGLHCYGNIMRNISEYYMLVLALCLVDIVFALYWSLMGIPPTFLRPEQHITACLASLCIYSLTVV